MVMISIPVILSASSGVVASQRARVCSSWWESSSPVDCGLRVVTAAPIDDAA
jgi:hypothetical protein